jgi:hypothetical protein
MKDQPIVKFFGSWSSEEVRGDHPTSDRLRVLLEEENANARDGGSS